MSQYCSIFLPFQYDQYEVFVSGGPTIYKLQSIAAAFTIQAPADSLNLLQV